MNIKDGDIIKKSLRSRQSWTVMRRRGKWIGILNTNRLYPDYEEIEIKEDDRYIIIANINLSNYE